MKKEIKTLLMAFCLALLFVSTKTYAQNLQLGIAQSVIRFHVIANSNSQADQNVKLAVRDKVLSIINPLITDCQTKEETIKILSTHLDLMEYIAQKELQSQGFNEEVKVSFETTSFPLKKYGDITFPSGNYDAVKIEIGEAEGENFWCVMFPSLCLVEDAIEDEEKLKNILSEEEYSVVTSEKSETLSPKIKFKIVEFFNSK